MRNRSPYSGYLAQYLDLITEAHARGLSLRAIAEALYDAGARAQSSEPIAWAPALTRDHHIRNLSTMAHYALVRLGLRIRKPGRKRLMLTARQRTNAEGETVWET
jgi:hypothetical protein